MNWGISVAVNREKTNRAKRGRNKSQHAQRVKTVNRGNAEKKRGKERSGRGLVAHWEGVRAKEYSSGYRALRASGGSNRIHVLGGGQRGCTGHSREQVTRRENRDDPAHSLAMCQSSYLALTSNTQMAMNSNTKGVRTGCSERVQIDL